MFPYFEARRCFSRHIEAVRVPVRGQKDVIVGSCVHRLGERGIGEKELRNVQDDSATKLLREI